MTNDINDTNPEEAVPCIALSKNDSYVMSASGGKVSLFNMMTFKVGRISIFSLYNNFVNYRECGCVIAAEMGLLRFSDIIII